MSQLEQQMRHRDRDMVPRFLVQAMFGLMAAALALVAYAQWFDVPNRGVLVEAPIVQSLEIVMEGNRNGVYDVRTPEGELLASSADYKGGFLGVIGRVVERARFVNNAPLTAPVTVAIPSRSQYCTGCSINSKSTPCSSASSQSSIASLTV